MKTRDGGRLTRNDAETRREAVLYARVSSKEQELGYSIAAQQELLRRYAAELNLNVTEFCDVESAKTVGRPGFAAMVAHLRGNSGCRVLLVEKTDRLYRNFKDYVVIDELEVEAHFVKENVVLTKDARSSDKFMHGIKVLMAKNYIDNLSEEVRKGVRTKAAQGLWPSFSPLGYVNVSSVDGKKIIVPDPILGPMVTKLFEWFATGAYSLDALAKKAYAEGFRFRKSRARVPKNTLHKVLRKRIYTGEFEYAGVQYRGIHEPLVTFETWERVQHILDGRHAGKHRKSPREFAFSGLVRCGHCDCSLVAEIKKGRYVYYHCTGYRGKCPEPYTREEVLQQQFGTALRNLTVPPPVLSWLRSELTASDETLKAARVEERRRLEAQACRLQTRLDVLYEDRLDGRIEASMYDAKSGEIRQQLHSLRNAILQLDQEKQASGMEALDMMTLLSRAAQLFESQTSAEQRRLLHLVVREAQWKGGELRMSFFAPFEKMRLSNSVSCSEQSRLGAQEANSDNWRRGGDSNSRYP